MTVRKILVLVAGTLLTLGAWAALAVSLLEGSARAQARTTEVVLPAVPASVPAAKLFRGTGVRLTGDPRLVQNWSQYQPLWEYAEFEMLTIGHWPSLYEPFLPQSDLWGNDDDVVYDARGKVVPPKFPWKHPVVAARMAPYYFLLGEAHKRGQKVLLSSVASGRSGWMGDGLGLTGKVRNRQCLPRQTLQTEYQRLLRRGMSPAQAQEQIERTLFGGTNDHPCYATEDGDEFAENLGELIRHLSQDSGRFGEVTKIRTPIHAISIWLEPLRTYERYKHLGIDRRPASHYPAKFITLFDALDRYLRRRGLRNKVLVAASSDDDVWTTSVIRQLRDPTVQRTTDVVDLHHYVRPSAPFSILDEFAAQTDKPLYFFEAGGNNGLGSLERPLTSDEIFLWALDSVRVLVEGANRGVTAVNWYFWAYRPPSANEHAMQAIDVDSFAPQAPYYAYCVASKTTLADSIVLKPTLSSTFQGAFSATGFQKGQNTTVLMVNRGPATDVTLRTGDDQSGKLFRVYAVSLQDYQRITELGSFTASGRSLGVVSVPADSIVSVTTLPIAQLYAPRVPDVSTLGLLLLLALLSLALRRGSLRGDSKSA